MVLLTSAPISLPGARESAPAGLLVPWGPLQLSGARHTVPDGARTTTVAPAGLAMLAPHSDWAGRRMWYCLSPLSSTISRSGVQRLRLGMHANFAKETVEFTLNRRDDTSGR